MNNVKLNNTIDRLHNNENDKLSKIYQVYNNYLKDIRKDLLEAVSYTHLDVYKRQILC